MCEHKLPENIPKDIAGIQNGHSADDRIFAGLLCVKCGEQRKQVDGQQAILPFMDKDQVPTRSCDVNKLTGVMPEKKTDSDECDSKRDGTRHWVVCLGGVLKEVKADHTIGASDVWPHQDGSQWLESNTITFLQHWQVLGPPVIVGCLHRLVMLDF